jgi:hypothetical protein
VLLRFGEREKALQWLSAIQELTREGPFGQAHFIHSPTDAEAWPPREGEAPAEPLLDGFPSRTRKASFYNGNCYFESAGCGFATTILEDLFCP